MIYPCHRRGPVTAKVHEPPIKVHACSEFGSCTLEESPLKAAGKPLANCAGCALRPRPEQEPELTIGIPFYRDWQGLSMTLASIRMNHDHYGRWQIVVIDNDPNGKPDEPGETNHSFKAKQMCRMLGRQGNVIYEHYTEVSGTAAAKGRVFHHATGRVVVVMDCHVIVQSFGLEQLAIWGRENPESKDLIHGVLLGDGCEGDVLATHMTPAWGSLMYGQWGVDQAALGTKNQEPGTRNGLFEIPMHGCGLFSCNRHAWPGFHPQLRGFGPEEFHLHQRVRRNGGRVMCASWLKWWHRFGNPGGASPPGLTREDRLRGHLITYLDTGKGDSEWFSVCKRHFIEAGMDEKTFGTVWVKTKKEFKADWQPVGDHVHAILEECGIKRSTCPVCLQWQQWMNEWGIAGCQQNRVRIITRLNEQAKGASWFEAIRVAGRGYLSTEAILDEALRRAGQHT